MEIGRGFALRRIPSGMGERANRKAEPGSGLQATTISSIMPPGSADRSILAAATFTVKSFVRGRSATERSWSANCRRDATA
jgi:hypothetical protein